MAKKKDKKGKGKKRPNLVYEISYPLPGDNREKRLLVRSRKKSNASILKQFDDYLVPYPSADATVSVVPMKAFPNPRVLLSEIVELKESGQGSNQSSSAGQS